MIKNLSIPSLIAEIGCNFAGSLERAKFLSKLAIDSGADYLKYQFFNAENLINLSSYLKVLSLDNTNLIKEINSLQLNEKQYLNLFNFNDENGYRWGSSFFSVEDAKLFFEKYQFQDFKTFSFIKIASGEITDIPLLDYLSRINKNLHYPVIISTGIATDREIKKAISFFKGFCEIYLLYCIVEYPVQSKEMNLKRIKYLKKKFKVETGFSDHSISIVPSIISLSYDAKIIEKHFTDSRENKEADNPISMLPEEFVQIKNAMKNYPYYHGDGRLKISEKEYKELTYARKGLYASQKIEKNSLIKPEYIVSRRPNLGNNDVQLYYKIINKKAIKIIEKDQHITVKDVKN